MSGTDHGNTDGVAVMVTQGESGPMTEARLNSTRSVPLVELDLAPTRADEDMQAMAMAALGSTGAIVIGVRYYDADGGRGRRANQVFLRADNF